MMRNYSSVVSLIACFQVSLVFADSSSPKVAAYYDRFMAVCNGLTYNWRSDQQPKVGRSGVVQVAVGKCNYYALSDASELINWRDDWREAKVIEKGVKWFSAGSSGLFVIRQDNSLWWIERMSFLSLNEKFAPPIHIADDVSRASVGDSANYFVTLKGELFVRGKAHRGQYGDGKLSATKNFIQTASDVSQVVAHTGHALILKKNGQVWGTGGNIYGPLSSHGYSDKATRWGMIMQDAQAIATGSSHTVAIKKDVSLWAWGRNQGIQPKQIMSDVEGVAAGSSATIALSKGYLWQWQTGKKPQKIMVCR